jgi:hypothetical protein
VDSAGGVCGSGRGETGSIAKLHRWCARQRVGLRGGVVRVRVHGSDGVVVRPGGRTRSSSFPSQSTPARFVVFSSFLLVARQCQAMAGEAVFGLAMVQLGRRGSWVLHELDNPEKRWWLCCAFDGSDGGGGSYRLLWWSRLATAGDRSQ